MKVKLLYIPYLFIIDLLFMHVIYEMQKIENNKILSHTNHNEHMIHYRKPLYGKAQLEGDITLLYFVWSGNNASTKENKIFMELLENYGPISCYRH